MQGVQAAQQFAASLGLGGAQRSPGSAPSSSPVPAPGPIDGGTPQFAPSPAPQEPSATDLGGMTQQPAPQTSGTDQIAALLQALQQRQIPALPGSAPAAAPVAPQSDALGLLRLMLANPQLQQALRGPAPAAVQLPVPALPAPSRQVRSVPVPLGAVLNAIVALAGHSMTELYEQTGEEEPEVPEYLVGEDGAFLVDPASADDRAALVAHLFRLNEAARRSGRYPQLRRRRGGAGGSDDSDAWAREAGFF